MEHAESADASAVTEIDDQQPDIEVVSDLEIDHVEPDGASSEPAHAMESSSLDEDHADEPTSSSKPTVDELESRLDVIEPAMEQLQAGNIAAAEDALVVLDRDQS